MAKEISIDLIMQDPKFAELAIKVMEMEPDYEEDWLVPFELDEVNEDTGKSIVRTRKGDYGKQISYIPAIEVRKRLDLAFNKKWSFFIIAEHRETEPFLRWDSKEEEYVDGSNYLKCIGMMIVPGFGIRMDYGVKKVFGDAESTDWKACKTDAFKKCAEAFGIYLNYMDDTDEEDGSGSGKGNKTDLSDVDYSDEDLEDAFETVLTFGKYSDYSLREILEEEDDKSYIEWLAENARDDDMRFFATVILKYNEEQEEEKSNRRKNRGRNNKKQNSSKSTNKNRNSSNRNSRKSSTTKSGNKRNKKHDEDEDEKDSLMELCRSELDNYDKIQARAMLTSVSVSNRYPKGKTKLEQFTLSELQELAEVLEVE